MTSREGSCRCGALRVTAAGAPVRVSVCHCRDCQRRSGSAFAVQARFAAADVVLTGAFAEWSPLDDGRPPATFRFCPACGTTVAFVSEGMPGMIAIPVGTFADPGFPPPTVSVYEERRHPWVTLSGEDMVHFD